MLRSGLEVGREEVAIMRTVLVALTTLAAIPLVVLGLLGIILGACWYGSETGGWWLGMGIYAMLQASVPCLMLLARTLLRKHEK
jgi:uncharacterized membrane protein YccC